MNNHYTPWYKAFRDFERRSVDARYHSSEEMGTSFAGKPCVHSSRKAAISATLKKNRQRTSQP